MTQRVILKIPVVRSRLLGSCCLAFGSWRKVRYCEQMLFFKGLQCVRDTLGWGNSAANLKNPANSEGSWGSARFHDTVCIMFTKSADNITSFCLQTIRTFKKLITATGCSVSNSSYNDTLAEVTYWYQCTIANRRPIGSWNKRFYCFTCYAFVWAM